MVAGRAEHARRAPATRTGADRGAIPADRSGRLLATLAVVSVVLVALPVAVAAGRAAAHHWLPSGDDALIVIRARDVFSRHPPLLGLSTSASESAAPANHPGPLLFAALAVPVTVLGRGVGAALGVGAINIAAIVGIALAVWRRGPAPLVILAMAVTGVLTWSMGSEVLYDPYQPNVVVLPFLCLLVLVWSLSCGDAVLLPWAVGVASLVVQTHIGYAYIVPVLGLWGFATLVLTSRRSREENAVGRGRIRWPRLLAISAAVLVVCWAPPIWEELHPGGNMTRLVDALRSSHARTVGLHDSLRYVARVLALPPLFFPPSYAHTFRPPPFAIGAHDLPSFAAAAGALGGLAVVLVGGWWLSRRRDRTAAWAFVTAGVAVVMSITTVSRVPRTGPFAVAPHMVHSLWPVAAFTTFAVLAALARSARQLERPIALGLVPVVAVLAAVNVPTRPTPSSTTDAWAVPAVRALDRQMGGFEHRRVLYDRVAGFLDVYGPAMLAELRARGVAFKVTDPFLERQLGPSRVYNGHNADVRMFIRTDAQDLLMAPGAQLVARYDGLSPSEQRERDRLAGELAAEIDAHGLRLTALGRRRLPLLGGLARQVLTRTFDGPTLIASGDLVAAWRYHMLDLDPVTADRLARYTKLVTRSRRVVVFAAPLARHG